MLRTKEVGVMNRIDREIDRRRSAKLEGRFKGESPILTNRLYVRLYFRDGVETYGRYSTFQLLLLTDISD